MNIRAILSGGDRRSIGRSNEVVASLLSDPSHFSNLIECLTDDNPIVVMRAADATEKISSRRPELLIPYKIRLLRLSAVTRQQELRWHLAQMLPRLPLSTTEKARVTAVMRDYLTDPSRIVVTSALQALFDLARGNAAAEAEVRASIAKFKSSDSAAVRARVRKLLNGAK